MRRLENSLIRKHTLCHGNLFAFGVERVGKKEELSLGALINLAQSTLLEATCSSFGDEKLILEREKREDFSGTIPDGIPK